MSHSFSGLHRRLRNRFGMPVTYTPAGGGVAATITGILDTSDARKPDPAIWGTLWVLQSDLTVEPAKGDIITISGVEYVLRGETWRHEDGAGGVYLWLRKK